MIQFFVEGRPRPAGSKSGFPIRVKPYGPKTHGKGVCKHCGFTGRVAMVDQSGDNGKDWRRLIQIEARKHFLKAPTILPVHLSIHFFLLRPKSHYGTGKNSMILKGAESANPAPLMHLQDPDATKLLRAVEDALNGIAWKDDNQVVQQIVSKSWGCRNEGQQGVFVGVLTGDAP